MSFVGIINLFRFEVDLKRCMYQIHVVFRLLERLSVFLARKRRYEWANICVHV